MLDWKEKLLNLFDDSIKNEIIIDGETFTMDGTNVYMVFNYKGKEFGVKFIYKYAYVSIDDRPNNGYLYTLTVYNKQNWECLFIKDVYTNKKLTSKDFELYI